MFVELKVGKNYIKGECCALCMPCIVIQQVKQILMREHFVCHNSVCLVPAWVCVTLQSGGTFEAIPQEVGSHIDGSHVVRHCSSAAVS